MGCAARRERWRTHSVATDHSASVSRARTWPCPHMFGPLRADRVESYLGARPDCVTTRWPAPALGDVLKTSKTLATGARILGLGTRSPRFRNAQHAASSVPAPRLLVVHRTWRRAHPFRMAWKDSGVGGGFVIRHRDNQRKVR